VGVRSKGRGERGVRSNQGSAGFVHAASMRQSGDLSRKERSSYEKMNDNNGAPGGDSVLEHEPDIRSQSLDRPVAFTEAKERISTAQELKKKGKKSKGKKADELKKEIEMDDHKIPKEELFARLGSSEAQGMSSMKAAERLNEEGRNELTPAKGTPWFIVFATHLFGGFSALLWTGAILSFIGFALDSEATENLYLGIVLVVVVTLTGCFAYYQEAKAGAVMKGWAKMAPGEATVLRDGKTFKMNAVELVRGDVVEVKGGDRIPADIRILESNGLKVDNSSLTGESEPQTRQNQMTHENPLETANLAFYSTAATEGAGKGVVISIGDNTVIGRIAGLASSTETVDTPIHREIQHFIHIICTIAICLGAIFFILGLVKGLSIIENLVFMISIIVANVPEGLLATVTVSLTLTAKRMERKQVFVKNLESVETLGSTTTICSDKTGTLTQNRMTVAHLWIDDTICTTDTSVTKGTYDTESPAFQSLYRCMAICNRAVFEPGQEDTDIVTRTTIGDASETAMIKFAQPSRDIIEIRESNPKVCEIPFNSRNKFSLSIHATEDPNDKRLVLLMKGAPERVLARCNRVLMNGQEVPMDEKAQGAYDEAYTTLGGMGERVFGFAQHYLDPDVYTADYEFNIEDVNFPMEGLCFIGLCSLIDPPRPQVPDAVRLCQTAGIKVIMVTGDHPITAHAIAKQVGIISSPTVDEIAKERGCAPEDVNDDVRAIVVNGMTLKDMDDEELARVLAYPEIVFARTSPQQKLRIVEGCQNLHQVVAVTGDGVNDSPALKKADIGIAMGITGSDVSKEAADMILLDDNFASIVRGVEEGRLIFDNLKKSIAYTLSSNIPELCPFLLFILIGIPLPLSTLLILCVDVGTDLIPAISLAYEKPESDIMKRPPRNAQVDRLVNARLICFSYLQIGIMQAMAGIFTYFVVFGDQGFPPDELVFSDEPFYEEDWEVVFHDVMWEWGRREDALIATQTAVFVAIIVVQWADLLICKTRLLSLFQQGMWNYVLNFGLFSETALALVITYTPYLGPALGTRPLRPEWWFPATPFSVFIFVYDELRKLWIRTYPGGWIQKVTYY